jgi:hypothetical protein
MSHPRLQLLEKGVRKSQAQTLTAAPGLGRASLPALGRRLAGGARCKRRIQRGWRFGASRRAHVGRRRVSEISGFGSS